MIKDHSVCERGNPLPTHGLLFPISSKGSFICTIDMICYTSRGALAGTRNSSMGPPLRIDPTTHRTMSERSYHGATSRSSVNMDAELINLMKITVSDGKTSASHRPLIP